jgi:hypothetical protein
MQPGTKKRERHMKFQKENIKGRLPFGDIGIGTRMWILKLAEYEIMNWIQLIK